MDDVKDAIMHLQSNENDVSIPPGLTNNGNTCYINSVLQVIYVH
jgi:ubiquitin C-terminal hydrolase